jgi:hypothetical protein
MATSQPDTSLSSAFRYAIDQPLENMATTFQALGMEEWETFMRDLVEEPENYESAAGKFINSQSPEWWDLNWEHFPTAVFEQAGQIAGSLLARGGGAALGAAITVNPIGAAVGALLGPALFEAVQIAGPVALERASRADPPRAEPNWDDWKGALGTSAASGVLNAIGIKNVGVLNSIGKGAFKQAGKQTVKAGVSEGVTEGFQGLTEQIGGSALTAQGLEIDPKAALAEGLLGTGAGTVTQAGTEVIGQVGPPALDGSLYSNPFTKLFGKKKEEVTEEPPTAPLQIEDQRPQEEISLDQMFGELEAEAQRDTPTLRKYLEPMNIKSLILNLGDMNGVETKIAYENLAKRIEAKFEEKNVPQEHRPLILAETLSDIKNEMHMYIESDDTRIGVRRGPGARFNLEKVDNNVDTKIAQYNQTGEPAVELPDRLKPDKFTRPLYNAPQFTSDSPASGYTGETLGLPIGSVQRVVSDPTVGFMIGEPNKLGFYPDKIDPQTGGYSVLRRHLTTIKKDLTSRYGVQGLINPGNPWKLFLGLGLEQNRNGFPVPRKKLKPINKKIANQAISSGIAERLLDLKAQGEPVLVAELDQILDDYYSRFNTTLLFDNQDDYFYKQSGEGRETAISADESQIKKEFLAKKQVQFEKEEIEKSEILPEGYDPGAANTPRDPLPNGEDRFWNEYEDVVLPKVAERLEKAEALFPAMVPFLAPKDPAYNAWENMDQTVHIDTQLQKYSDNNFSKERIGDKWGGYYLEPASSEIGPGSFLEMWAAFHPRLDAASENAYGLDLDLRKDHSLEYDRSGPNHSLVPGTYGWTRGLLMSHEPGALGYGFWEMQQDIYRQGDPKGPRPEWRKLRFRSEVAETELTPGEKTLQRKLDAIDNAIEAYVSAQESSLDENALALVAPFMPLEKDTGRTGPEIRGTREFSSTQDYPISPQQFPRYAIKGGIPSRDNGQLRQLFRRAPETRIEDAADAFFDPLPEQGQDLTSGGPFIRTFILKNMLPHLRYGEMIESGMPANLYPLGRKAFKDVGAAQKELERTAKGKAEDIFYDWLLEAQPFRSLGRVLSSRDAKNIIIDSEIRGEIEYWEPSFGSFFNQVELADSEVEATIAKIKYIMPFVEHLAWQQMAPTVLKKARPFATMAIGKHPELAPVLDLYLNPDKNFTQENISRLEEKELTGRIEEKDKIPDYPHKGTQYGKEADWAKDLLHRGIVKLLQTFPDITHVYLHKYGTEGSPVYPYVEVIKEAKKMAKELGLDMKKIGEYPTKAALGKKEGGRTVLTDVTNEVWALNIEKMREIVLMGGYESMRKGGVVKKAVNHTMNYGNYGRRII